MPAYLISYSTATEQTRADLDEFMDVLGAVPLGECLCGLEMNLGLDAFRDWLTSQLEECDALVVIELRPRFKQSSQNLSREAVAWLEEMLKPRAV
ncbi:hypothetical protein SAMN04489759_1194 [Sulfitobacter delicatus]|uniref:Uncharacterized protein n=1 Tax=Sulfitobacter delicatus TaxID=218672 RepID=A0A1G7Z569_9RHOB|nr:hypothetical protein SAMN04489759_1194 [Sulfitobacter delicatus]